MTSLPSLLKYMGLAPDEKVKNLYKSSPMFGPCDHNIIIINNNK